jgi:hypothetical protein
VGQTQGAVSDRWHQHVYWANRDFYHIPLHNAIRKYGEASFLVVELAKASSLEELNELEMKFILQFDSMRAGYNCNAGGDGCRVPSSETRKKMSDSAKNRDRSHIVGPWRGKTFSNEHREAISAGLTGKKHTEERRHATFNARKTHCKHGHEFTVENTYVTPTGSRQCKACRFAAVKAWRNPGRCLSTTL